MTFLAQATIESLPLADNSVDLIFTDPPYKKEYLPCYAWLAKESMRVLKPGGFVLTMCGGIYINQIYRMFDNSGLTFFWEYHVYLSGWAAGIVWTRSHPKKTINVRNKPILAYSKYSSTPRTSTISLFNGGGEDKKYHEWGQDIESARYYIDCFSHKDDLVCDPFIGGGTTGIACMALQRRFVGFDLDMNALFISRDRIDGKRKENLHELPLFRNLDNGTNGKDESVNLELSRSDQEAPDQTHKDYT